MKVEVYKLFKEDPILLHIGLRRMDRTSTFINSDTLFSALANSFVKLFGEDKFNIFETNLLISSIFIGLRLEGKDILLLPMPEIPIKIIKEDEQYKKYKKIQWVSKEALFKLLESFDKENLRIIMEDTSSLRFLNSKTLLLKDEFEQIGEEITFIDTILEPKVSVDRENNKSINLYFQENLLLSEIKTSKGIKIKPLLYFIKYINHEIENLFIPTINLFLEEGLGGERTTGKGFFDYYEKEELTLPDQGDFEITLSATIPKREETDNLIYYQLIKRDGFIYYNYPTGIRKKTHYKIKEGALVKSPYIGENINVSPIENMKVISYGKNLGLKFS